jgi:Flp pilus assembly protein TadB
MNGMPAAGPHDAGAALTVASAHLASAVTAWRWSGSLTALLGGVFVVLLVTALLVISVLRGDERHRRVLGGIERYGPRHVPSPAEAGGKIATAAIGGATRLLRSSKTEQGLAQRLDLAGIARPPAEWVLLGGCGALALTAAVTVATGNILIGLLIGLLVGWIGMRLSVSIRIGRRRAAFADQLPDVLQLVASSLSAGFSLAQALRGVVREDTQPAAGEFARALAEARVGVDIEAALDAVANRMDSDDLRWTCMAIRIQREVGGNLAEVLGTTAETMRERAYLQRHVRALSAEGRLSAYILTALPILIGCWLLLRDQSYMRPLYTTTVGLIMLGAAAALFVIGAVWMRILIKVEA